VWGNIGKYFFEILKNFFIHALGEKIFSDISYRKWLELQA
jgi:hypothetical protein